MPYLDCANSFPVDNLKPILTHIILDPEYKREQILNCLILKTDAKFFPPTKSSVKIHPDVKKL